MEETRIYVAVAATVQAVKHAVQPPGRQIAQACHAVSKLRWYVEPPDDTVVSINPEDFTPVTTIVVQVRDSKELFHVFKLAKKHKLNPFFFSDQNIEAYGGTGNYPTAVAFYATKTEVERANLGYLPLWGVQ